MAVRDASCEVPASGAGYQNPRTNRPHGSLERPAAGRWTPDRRQQRKARQAGRRDTTPAQSGRIPERPATTTRTPAVTTDREKHAEGPGTPAPLRAGAASRAPSRAGQRASQTSTEKIGSPSRLLSTSMPNPAPVGTRPMPFLERGWWPATCSFDQSFMKDTVKRLSG